MAETNRDLTRTVLAVLFIAGLIISSFWILRPFLGAIVWAATIVVATWPVMLALQARLWGKRGLAVTVMTLALLSVLIVPFSLAVGAIVANVDEIVARAKSLATLKVPPTPAWVASLPLIGDNAAQAWDKVAASGIEGLAAQAAPYVGNVISWFAAAVGSFGLVLLQFLLTVVISGILYQKGESAATGVRLFARRLAGARGEDVVSLAGQAIRGVALGVVLTAFLQAILGGIGLAVAGVPFASVLTAVMFILAIAQIGPLPVLVPVVIWVYSRGNSGWGTFLVLWTIVVGTMDNLIRPVLIKRGADLPLLLIFAGVIGGLATLGLIGIFVGPVVLAVAYTLLDAWVRDEDTGSSRSVK